MSFARGTICNATDCVYRKRQKTKPDVSFFQIPIDSERSKKWIVNCGRKDLLDKDVKYLHSNIRFCSLHFEDSQFMNIKKNRLVWNAVPTLFDVQSKPGHEELEQKLNIHNQNQPDSNKIKSSDTKQVQSQNVSVELKQKLNIPNKNETDSNKIKSSDEKQDQSQNFRVELKRKLNIPNENEPDSKKIKSSDEKQVQSKNITDLNNDDDDVLIKILSVQSLRDFPEIICSDDNEPLDSREHNYASNKVMVDKSTSFPENPTTAQTELNIAEHKIKQLENNLKEARKRCKTKSTQIRRLGKKVKQLKEHCFSLKNLNKNEKSKRKNSVVAEKNHVKTILSEYLSKEALSLLLGQIRKDQKCKNIIRWDYEVKAFALNLYFCSHRGYHMLSKYFQLPSVRTLQKLIEGVKTHCGVNENVFSFLKERIKYMKEHERILNLSVGKRALRCHLSYDVTADCIIGFEDFGKVRSPKVVSSALVIMINGIFSKMRQPLMYFLSNNHMSHEDFNGIFFKVVSELKKIGFTVKTCVTDLSKYFMSWREFIGITIGNPYLLYDGDKIYFLYDASQVIKSVRSNLLKYDFQHKLDNAEYGTASWKHILNLYQSDSHKKYKLAPKLTKKAVYLPPHSKIKVCAVARVFSRAVAVALETLVSCGSIESAALSTSELCKKINDWFDIFNGFSMRGPVKLRNCIGKKSKHLGILLDIIKWIETWKIYDSENSDITVRVMCVEGLKINSETLIMLVEELFESSGRGLLTRRVSQDGLEDLFPSFRHKGSLFRISNPQQFITNFNSAMLKNLMKSDKLSISNNESVDWGRLILDSNCAEKPKQTSLLLDNNNSNLQTRPIIKSNDISKDLRELNSMFYVIEYILTNFFTIHKCDRCKLHLIGIESSIDGSSIVYLNDEMSENGIAAEGLVVCTEDTLTFFKECETYLASVFEEFAHKKGCGSMFVKYLLNVPGFPEDCCQITKISLIKLFVKLRLNYTIAFWNDMFQSKKKKDKKDLRISYNLLY